MAFTTTILVPTTVTHAEGDLSPIEDGIVYDMPPIVGDLTDGSDSTYTEIGSYMETSGAQHIERITADFVLTEGTPIACLVQLRAKNNADVLADPPTDLRLLYQVLARTADSGVLFSRALGNVAPETWPVGPLTQATVTEPEWFTWWYDSHPNLADPSFAGKWYPLEGSEATALTEAGLRVTLGWVWRSPDPARRAWLDVYEIRLLVALVSDGRLRRRPLRQFPRSDGLGMSSARRQDANRSMQASLRRGGGVYF